MYLRRRIYQILELATKGDSASKVLDIFLISLIVLSVIAIVLESVQSINEKYYTLFYYFEIFAVSIFSLEYILRVWACVENPKWRRVTSNKLKLRSKYIFSFEALVDLFAVLPFYLVLFGLSGNIDLRFLRSFRLLRIFKLTRYSGAFDVLFTAFKENASAFGAAFFVLLIVMLLAATGMYYFEHKVQPVAFGSILASMWWAFATLTTVGYGDVTPITAGGKVFGALITVLGVGMVALPTAILASAFSEQLRIRSSKYEYLADQAYEDGILTEDEKIGLEKKREELGLSKDTADLILINEHKKLNKSSEENKEYCPHCGSQINVSDNTKTDYIQKCS